MVDVEKVKNTIHRRKLIFSCKNVIEYEFSFSKIKLLNLTNFVMYDYYFDLFANVVAKILILNCVNRFVEKYENISPP